MRPPQAFQQRRGALTVEAALVHPVMIGLLLAIVIGGMGVFQYQQVACQAREAARWAAVRGGDYQKYANGTSPTQDQIRQQAVLPMAAGMATESLTVQVWWVDQGTGTAYAWDGATKEVMSLNSNGEYVTNTVRVTVSYQWIPNFLGLGPLTLQSTCEMPMAN